MPFPEEAALMLGGFFISQNFMEPIATFLVAYPAMLAADYLLYSLGKRYGRRLVESAWFRRIASPDKISRLEERFLESGSLLVFFGRFSSLIRVQIFLAAGISRVPAFKFILADAASALITAPILIGIGYAAGNSYAVLRHDITRIEHISIFLAVVIVFGWILVKYFRSWIGRS